MSCHLSYSSHVISAWFFRLWAQLNNSQLGTQSCLDTSKDDRWKWWLEREQIHFHERIHCFFTASVDGICLSIYLSFQWTFCLWMSVNPSEALGIYSNASAKVSKLLNFKIITAGVKPLPLHIVGQLFWPYMCNSEKLRNPHLY